MVTGEEAMQEDRAWFRVFAYEQGSSARLICDGVTLEALALRLQQHVAPQVEGHIWQHDSLRFALQPTRADIPRHLGACVRFGDNVEDEWLCVSLLFAITKHFPDVIVQMHDNDGEMLLIEAADALPRWLEPDTSDNRIFVVGGKLHIVPPPSAAPGCAGLPAEPTLAQALAIVRASVLSQRGDAAAGSAAAARTEADAPIQQLVRQRIQGYPAGFCPHCCLHARLLQACKRLLCQESSGCEGRLTGAWPHDWPSSGPEGSAARVHVPRACGSCDAAQRAAAVGVASGAKLLRTRT